MENFQNSKNEDIWKKISQATPLSRRGNRVSLFNPPPTFPHRRHPDTFLLAIDKNNRGLLINLRRCALLHRITFKHRVGAVKFRADRKLIAVAVGKLVQIWIITKSKNSKDPYI